MAFYATFFDLKPLASFPESLFCGKNIAIWSQPLSCREALANYAAVNRMNSTLSLILVLSVLYPSQVVAAPISAEEVVRLAHAQDPAVREAREAVALAEADRIEAGLYPNPNLEWEREHLGEESLLLSLPIDLSGARAAREHLAGADLAGAKAAAALVTSGVVVRALTVFYQFMGHQRREVIEAQALERLSEAARVVRRRREEGSVSGYDQSRIEIEEELAASALRQTQAGTERLRGELASLLGRVASEVEFVGSLEADTGLVLQSTEKSDQESRTSQRLLRSAVESAGAARRAASWSWLPGLVLSGGPLLSSVQRDREGYKVEVALEVPLFSRGQELRARADARQRQAQARVEAGSRAGHRERSLARVRLVAAREEALRFAETTGERIERLERAARSGYREGALSLVELLDVQRTRTQLELRQLELSLALKEAEVALRAARGDYE